MERFLRWLSSPSGQKAVYISVGSTSIAIMVGALVPNTFFLYKYQEFVQCYRHGISVKLSENVLNRYDKALDLLKVSNFDRKLISPFVVFGFDMFSAGSAQSRFGGILGIPINFTYIDGNAIDKHDIMINNEPIMWTSEPGQQLLSSLQLSENAQIFAIAKEILSLKSFNLFLDTVYASTSVILTYMLSRKTNEKLQLYHRPRLFRSLMYMLTTTFGFGIYSFLTDYTQIRHDRKVDKKLSEISPEMLQGGKEFYEKTLLRNKALRNLMGRTGEKYYTALGNENFFIRQKRLPLLVRKQFFESKINELKL